MKLILIVIKIDNISSFNIYDSDEPVSIESLVKNDHNDNINNISNGCLLTPVNEQNLEVVKKRERKMIVVLIN